MCVMCVYVCICVSLHKHTYKIYFVYEFISVPDLHLILTYVWCIIQWTGVELNLYTPTLDLIVLYYENYYRIINLMLSMLIKPAKLHMVYLY